MQKKPQPDRREADDHGGFSQGEFPNRDRRVADPFRVPIEPNSFDRHRIHIGPPVVSASKHATIRTGVTHNSAAALMRPRG